MSGCPTRERSHASQAGLSAWAGPGALAAAFALLAWWSWGKWTDAQIDFGNELYIPWQLSTGKALYRDIAHRNGPLSQYLNTLWFLLFGVSIRTLVYCNLAILAVICALAHRLLGACCGRLGAAVAVLVLLGVFGFSQYLGIANYNYVTPYQHCQTHGLVLSFAMIAALVEHLRRRTLRWCGLAGVCLGLVFLTKAELVVPAAAAGTLGLALACAVAPAARRSRVALCLAGGALLPVAVGFALLWMQMPAGVALRGVLGNWSYLGIDLLADPFYARRAGLDDVPGNLRRALWMAGGITGTAVLAVALDGLLPRCRRRTAWGAAAGIALFAALVRWSELVPWPELARALPLTSLTASVVLAILCFRSRRDRAALLRRAPLALWAVFSLLLLGKIILHVRFDHYGFALAMPAALLLVAGLVHAAPEWVRRRRGGGELTRAIGLACVAAGLVFFLRSSDAIYAKKDLAVGRGRDAIWVEGPATSPRGRAIAGAMESLETLMPARATLLVLPEGIGLNYWLRRRNPSRFNLFLPTEMAAFGGEAVMLADLRAHAPDFVVLMHREYGEFGVGPFGTGPRSGRRIAAWVDANYRRLARIGAQPFGSRRFGIAILRRRRPE